jgi:putative membrane protein
MMVTTRGSVLRMLLWQWKKVLLFTAAATVVAVMHRVFELQHFRIPTTPMLIVGAALGIFVSFRTNTAYDRWWEGRRLWGQLVNSSRHLVTQALTYLKRKEVAREVTLRHAGYVHVLRCLLRDQDPWSDPHVTRLLDADTIAALRGETNPTHALIHRQAEALTAAADRGETDAHRLQSLDRTIAALLDVQGGCERIKKTPMPRGYVFIAERLIVAYGTLFPLALSEELGWAVIPISVLVCMSFALISEAGRVLEDPFSTFWNGLPLSALSLTIEANLRQRLGDTEAPEIPKPDARGILM